MADKLLQLVKRRHPLYEAMREHWDFVEETYEGGRCWFAANIFKYLKEGDNEYAARVKRAYRFNHTKQVVDLVDKYLFRQPIARKVKDAPEQLRRFWKKATRNGLDMDTLAKRISSNTSKFGRVWIVVDSTAQEGMTFSRADEKQGAVRIYAYILRPQDMLDMSYDTEGSLNWALVHEPKRDDENPWESDGAYRDLYRLWTRDTWHLYELTKEKGKDKVREIDAGYHGLGIVPIVQADHVFSEEPFESSGLIDDVAYLDRAVANYLSNLDAIIQDQTFSQLAMPAQGVLPGEDAYDKLVTMGTKRVFLYNGEAAKGPEYLSPDVKQADLIMKAVGKNVDEIYHSIGLAGERTNDDNGGAAAAASGVSKAYDFEKVNSLLVAKADALQLTERRIAEVVMAWNGVEYDAAEKEAVLYPRDFDTRGLYDEFEIAARLSLLAAPDEVRRQQMATLTKKLFPAASEDDQKRIDAALADWPPEDLIGLGEAGGAPKQGSGPLKAASNQKTAKELAA